MMFDSNGDNTPPTHLAMSLMVTLRVGVVRVVLARGPFTEGDPMPDCDLVGSDKDVFDKQLRDAPALVDGRGLRLVAELGEKPLQVGRESEVCVTVLFVLRMISFMLHALRRPLHAATASL